MSCNYLESSVTQCYVCIRLSLRFWGNWCQILCPVSYWPIHSLAQTTSQYCSTKPRPTVHYHVVRFICGSKQAYTHLANILCFLVHVVEPISMDARNSLGSVWTSPTRRHPYNVIDCSGVTQSYCSSQVCKLVYIVVATPIILPRVFWYLLVFWGLARPSWKI